MRDKKTKISRASLTVIALVSIGLGFLKIYLHFNSIFRLEPLDYLVGIGAIFGGLMVFTRKRTIVIFMLCTVFLAIEALKAIVDILDPGDVFLCTIAIICLAIPIIRYAKKWIMDNKKDNKTDFLYSGKSV